MFQDFRFAARMLLKQPGFSWIAVFTLALGSGATSAGFSLIQGVLLSPPPYRQPERLALIPSTRNPETGHTRTWAAAQWMDWQKEAKSFEDIAGYSWTFNFLMLAEGSESVEGMWVTPNYFGVMGLKPLLGRTFGSSETGVRPAPVIILGYGLWQRRFGGDPNIVGKTVRISRSETPPTVIGVMPEAFHGITQELEPPDIWVPVTMIQEILLEPGMLTPRMLDFMHMVARRSPQSQLAADQAWLDRQIHDYVRAGEGAIIASARQQEIELAEVLVDRGRIVLEPVAGQRR